MIGAKSISMKSTMPTVTLTLYVLVRSDSPASIYRCVSSECVSENERARVCDGDPDHSRLTSVHVMKSCMSVHEISENALACSRRYLYYESSIHWQPTVCQAENHKGCDKS